MSDDLNKIALMSGKLNGVKTLKFVLDSIEEPDEIELFLREFNQLKLEFDISNETIYINDNQSFLEHLNAISNSQFISIYTNDDFTTLYITNDEKKTYVIRTGKLNNNVITKLFSKEQPVKFLFNSFNFIKWCVSQKIELKNMFDIPTYIKILTNEIDPFKSIESYINEYTNLNLEENNNKINTIIIGNFIYEFGKYLHEKVLKFNIDNVCKIIGENSYYEALMQSNNENCVIRFKYSNLEQAIESKLEEKENEFKDKVYILSPHGRIALKFGHNVKNVIEDVYLEDVSITILNELYNNNIHVTLEDEYYSVKCKYKNITNVFSLITAIMDDVFYTMFEQTFEASISCEIL